MSSISHTSSDALAQVFARCRTERRAALVGYLPSGFPDGDTARDAVRAAATAGCDVMEIGVSYSDPMLDGPVIQEATSRALAGGVSTRDVFPLAEAIAEAGAVPVVMSYWNPILQYGVDAFARDLAAAGGTGMITPDLVPEEAEEWVEASEAYGLDRHFLVAPSTTRERLATTLAASSGFVYAQSVMGVTGARGQVSSAAPTLVARIREQSTIPVGVGLGVKSRDQAAELAGYADAVIVGSALVSALDSEGVDGVSRLAASLAEGVRDACPYGPTDPSEALQ